MALQNQFSLKITLTYAALVILVILLPFTKIVKITLLCLAFILLHFFFKRNLERRIATFASAAKQYLKNDPNQVPLSGLEDEFGPLVKALNQTGLLLRSRIQEKEAEKKNFSVVLDHMVEGVIAVDSHHQILLINQAARTMFPNDSKTLVARSLIEFSFHTELDAAVKTAIQEGGLHSLEIEIDYPEEKILSVHIVGIGKTANEISAILVLHDMSKIRKLENIRRDFVANVSHEIRTPLTSILGFIETLLSGAGENPETRKSFLQMMLDDSQRLSRLINDLLEISRLESREIRLNKSEVRLEPLVSKILQMFRPQIIAKKIKVQNELEGQSSAIVMADEDKIKQVLINLLDNAIKFNREEGLIKINAYRTADQQICITIEDQGVGIPEESIPRVFERFFRVDKARSRSSGGSGLGLAIVKHIVEVHSGKVSCKSRLDQGSIFSVTFPSA